MEETTEKTAEKKARTEGAIPRIRTYANDMKSAIDSRGATLASIANTEQTANKKRPRAVPGVGLQNTRTRVVLFGTIALFVLGTLLVGTTYFLTRSSEQTIETPTAIIFANKTHTIETVGVILDDVLATVRQEENLTLGEIENIVLTQNGQPLDGPEIARAIGLPDAVAREVTDAMLGLHAFHRNQPFIILNVTAYDRSFNALLAQEKNLARNLGNFFAPNSQVVGVNAENTAPNLLFEDLSIRNADVRISQNQWPLLYTYHTRTLLILTTNEFTLREITTRYSNTIR